MNELLDQLAELVASKVTAQMRAGAPGGVDQTTSPLGRRRHCQAVRARLARGEAGASIIGRRHLLSPEALSEELARATTKRSKAGTDAEAETPSTSSVRDELERELRVIRGGKGAG